MSDAREDWPLSAELILPFAGVPLADDGSVPSIELPALPRLAALLARLPVSTRDEADAYSPSPPHERALARALGFEGAAGCLPWAAHAAASDGIATGDLAWGLLSPVHWQVGREHLTMGDPDELGLDLASSRAFFEVLQPLFESEGWLLVFGAPTRWYLAHESLGALATASPDRVIGRNPDLWLPDDPAARGFKRLASEVQMLLYTHPLNAQREARGELPLNSVWLSGCGVRQRPRADATPVVDQSLRGAALAGDADAWRAAWQALDAGRIADLLARAERGEAVALTLCGERSALRLETPAVAPGLWQRLRHAVAPPRIDLPALLASL
ncbi:hypothetical protein [Rivibacter subsaxonicus]|uniref:Phosphoglycerate mutase n=1 Tax=Rivibacter subsaxonicus TaxID=457575 RepID=A0A4Q7W0J6_9BURK|nr:hypothetical protein [Rivibacter subsaxonicus]RZU02523.1 hypothetical protein EV670_0549 [Rivibacter subsaxonicus]